VRKCAVLVLAVLCVGLGVIESAAAAGAKSIKVTAGKPSEFKFKLSTTKAKLGKVTFTVTNSGAIVHDFKVCAKSSKNAKANTCNGKGSKKLSPHQTTKIVVTFKTKGAYEYLCTVPGHAAAGMKGLVTVS
jgi:uncharacterized cupredoxin-like copper-binding protein